MQQMKQLVEMMNLKLTGELPVVVMVGNHREALPMIWAAMRDGLYDYPPLLLRFDACTDTMPSFWDWGEEAPRVRDLSDIIALTHCLPAGNTKWVSAAMELGLVEDIVNIYTKGFCDRGAKIRPDHRGFLHEIFALGRLSKELAYGGSLSDDALENELKPLWETLKWHPIEGWDAAPTESVWFDVDPNFAVHLLEDESGFIPWRMQDFLEEYTRPPAPAGCGRYAGRTTAGILVPVLQRARLTTTCGVTGNNVPRAVR
jgi:hypothetical protein